jgi:hypothetical protein
VRGFRRSAVLSGLLTLAAGPGAAQEFELTPFAGVRGGGELSEATTNRPASLDGAPSFGLAAAFKVTGEGRFVEAFWSRQSTEAFLPGAEREIEVDLDLLQVGGSYRWTGPSRRTRRSLEPFVTVTVGAALVSGQDGGREAVAAGTLGAGFRWLLGPRLALRFDGRGIALFEVGEAAIACGGGCSAGLSGGGTTQFEATVALSVGF